MELQTDTFVIDPIRGNFANCEVSREGYDFVFSPPNNLGTQAIYGSVKPRKKPSTAYIDFIDIRKKAKCRILNGEQKPDGEIYIDELLQFAQSYGPLFGFGLMGAQDDKLTESIYDWITAQTLMADMVNANLFSKGEEIEDIDFKDKFFVDIGVSYIPSRYQYCDCVYAPNLILSNFYLNYVSEHKYWPYTTNDKTAIATEWLDSDQVYNGMGHDIITCKARFISSTDIEAVRMNKFPCKATIANLFDLKDGDILQASKSGIIKFDSSLIECEVSALAKTVADAHLSKVHVNFTNPLDDDEEGQQQQEDCDEDTVEKLGGLFIKCESLLSYMWYRYASDFGNSKLLVCKNPKCRKLFVRGSKNRDTLEYCCKKCQGQSNDSKFTERERRIREAFYKNNSWEDIHFAGYGVRVDEHMTERQKEEFPKHYYTIERIIEKVKTTKKGKKAAEAGSGEKKNKEFIQNLFIEYK